MHVVFAGEVNDAHFLRELLHLGAVAVIEQHNPARAPHLFRRRQGTAQHRDRLVIRGDEQIGGDIVERRRRFTRHDLRRHEQMQPEADQAEYFSDVNRDRKRQSRGVEGKEAVREIERGRGEREPKQHKRRRTQPNELRGGRRGNMLRLHTPLPNWDVWMRREHETRQ